MFYLNYLKEVPSEAFMFIKYRKTQQKDKCFTNTFWSKAAVDGPELSFRRCQRPYGRNGQRERNIRCGTANGLPLWLCPAVCD